MLRKLVVVIAVLGLLHTGPLSAAQAPEVETVVLDVPGMTCSFCPITIRKALEKVPGVIKVESDFDSRTARVLFDPAKADVEALTRATANAGYPSTVRKAP